MLIEYGVSREREAASLPESSAVIAGLNYDQAQDHETRDYSGQFSIRLHLRQLLVVNRTARQGGAARLVPNLKPFAKPLQGKTVVGKPVIGRLSSNISNAADDKNGLPLAGCRLPTAGLLLNAHGKMIVPELPQEVR
jgi:hypothetical protein